MSGENRASAAVTPRTVPPNIGLYEDRCPSVMDVPKNMKTFWFFRELNLGLLAHNPLTLSRGDQENDVRLMDEDQECP